MGERFGSAVPRCHIDVDFYCATSDFKVKGQSLPQPSVTGTLNGEYWVSCPTVRLFLVEDVKNPGWIIDTVT